MTVHCLSILYSTADGARVAENIHYCTVSFDVCLICKLGAVYFISSILPFTLIRPMTISIKCGYHVYYHMHAHGGARCASASPKFCKWGHLFQGIRIVFLTDVIGIKRYKICGKKLILFRDKKKIIKRKHFTFT